MSSQCCHPILKTFLSLRAAGAVRRHPPIIGYSILVPSSASPPQVSEKGNDVAVCVCRRQACVITTLRSVIRVTQNTTTERLALYFGVENRTRFNRCDGWEPCTRGHATALGGLLDGDNLTPSIFWPHHSTMRTQTWQIVTDGVGWSVSLSVTIVGPETGAQQ